MRSTAAVAIVCVAASLAGASGCRRDVERLKREYVARGDRYIQDKNVDAAIIEYRNAIQQDASYGDAYRKLSAAYLSRGEKVEALRNAVAAADLLPDNADAQIEAGGMLLLAGKFVDAKSCAERVLLKDPKNVHARVLLGNATAGLKDIDSAVKEFEEAIRLDPTQSGIYTGLATLKASQGDRVAAESSFKQAIEIDPSSTLARLALAQFYWSADKVDDAERVMKEALAIAPRDARVNLTIAVFYQATRRGDDAEPFLRTAAEESKDPRLTMMLADFYIAHDRRSDAVKLLQPLASDRRVGPLVSLRLASIAQLEGRADEALTIVNRALELQPNNSSTMAAKSDLLRSQNKLDEAAKAAEAAVAANPSSAEAQFVRGRVLQAQGHLDKAEQAFNQVLRLNPRAAAAQVEIARLRVRTGAEDAVAVATVATKADPRSLDAQLTLARALMHKREFAKARTILEEARAAAPTVAAVHAQLGSLLAMASDAVGARQSFARALEIDPLQLEAAGGLTALDFAANRRADAIARLDAMVSRAPKNSRLLVLTASALASDNNFERAETLLVNAIEIDPAMLNAYSLLGRIYFKQKRLDAARAQFERMAERQDKPVGALTLIGTIDMLQNRTAEAEKTFERVLSIDPKAGVAANNLAWLYLENGGSVDLALHLAEVAQAALPNAAEVHDTLGWAHYKKNAMPPAITAFRRSVELDPNNATAIYHLALAYEKSGDRQEARAVMTRYLQIDPSSDRSADIRRRLQTLGT
jgi:tetratricopeptide (TPR) repeat protein